MLSVWTIIISARKWLWNVYYVTYSYSGRYT